MNKIFYFLLINWCCCADITAKEEKIKVRCFKVYQIFPNITPEGKAEKYDTIPHKVFFYKEQIVFQSAYTHNFHSADGEIAGEEYRYRTFVYTVGNKYGYLFDSLAQKYNAKTDVDSLFSSDWYFHLSNWTLSGLPHEKYRLISSDYDKSNGILVETYLSNLLKEEDTTLRDTLVLSYSKKIKNINYSFDAKLDSIKDMKLFKVKEVSVERFLKEYNITLDKLITGFWIEKCPVENEAEILAYFDLDRKNNQQGKN